MKHEEIAAYKSSGNIYADVGHPNPEEAVAKSELAREIWLVIKRRRLTQSQAAEIMGVDQPRVSDIVRGKLSKYTIDRLMRFLRLLGRDIEIRVKRHPRRTEPTRLHVIGVAADRRRPSRRARM